MKRTIKLLLFLVLIMPLYIYAECKDEDLNEWATKAEVVFTEDMPQLKENSKYAYFFSVSPMRNDIRFVVIDKNKVPAESRYFETNFGSESATTVDEEKLLQDWEAGVWGNKDEITDPEELIKDIESGKVIESQSDMSKYTINNSFYGVGCYVSEDLEEETYTIKIYGNDNSKCKNELLKTITYTVPRYNRFEKDAMCETYPEHELCQTFSNKTKNLSENEFNRILKDYDKKERKKEFTISKMLSNLLSYGYYIIIPFVIITIIYFIRKRSIKESGDDN